MSEPLVPYKKDSRKYRAGAFAFMGCMILIFAFPVLLFLFWMMGFLGNLATGLGD